MEKINYYFCRRKKLYRLVVMVAIRSIKDKQNHLTKVHIGENQIFRKVETIQGMAYFSLSRSVLH